MTKQQEIAVFDKAIAALGPDSYLGPWLAEVRSEVESNIRSDFFPQVTLKDAAASVTAIIDAAKEGAGKIVADAERKALDIENSAKRVRETIASAIYAAQRELNKW